MPYTIKRAADVTEYYPYLLPGRHCFTEMMVHFYQMSDGRVPRYKPGLPQRYQEVGLEVLH